MGFEHVIPQFALRLKRAAAQQPERTTAVRDPGRRQPDAQLLPRRRSGARRHGDARKGRASRHLSHRHDRGDHHRGRWRGAWPRMSAARSSWSPVRCRRAAPQRRCPDIAQARQARLCAAGPAGQGPAADHRLVLGQRASCATLIRYRDIRRSSCRVGRRDALLQGQGGRGSGETCHRRRVSVPVRQGEASRVPNKIARAAGTGGSVPVECCQVCGNERLETVLSLGYMPPVNQMVPVGAGAAATAVVSDHAALLLQLRAGAAWARGRSGHHLPAGISLHQRHDQAAARQFRRALRRVVENAGARQGRSDRRHRLQRRHADLEFPEGRPPHPRHRADRRVQDRQRARHPDASSATSPRTWRAR